MLQMPLRSVPSGSNLSPEQFRGYVVVHQDCFFPWFLNVLAQRLASALFERRQALASFNQTERDWYMDVIIDFFRLVLHPALASHDDAPPFITLVVSGLSSCRLRAHKPQFTEKFETFIRARVRPILKQHMQSASAEVQQEIEAKTIKPQRNQGGWADDMILADLECPEGTEERIDIQTLCENERDRSLMTTSENPNT